MSQPDASQPNQPTPKFDPNAAHMRRPKLRPVRGFPVQGQGPDGKPLQLMGLADARQIASKVIFTMPAARLRPWSSSSARYTSHGHRLRLLKGLKV